MQRHRKSAALLGAAGLLMVVCGASAPSAAKAQSAFPKQSLTIYAALTTANGATLTQDFERYDPNANVTMVTGGTGTILSRVAAEQAAGGVHANVIMLADPTSMASLSQEKLLASYVPKGTKNLAKNLKGPGWEAPYLFNNVIIYHKGMSLPIPTSWKDLTKPIYKNEIELGNPSYSGTTLGMVGYLSQTLGWKYFHQLESNGAVSVASTNTVGVDVAAGTKDIGISLDVVARNFESAGSPVGIVWPKDGAVVAPAPVGIVAKNNNATARIFLNWLFSKAGQNAWQRMGYQRAIGQSLLVPAHTKVDNPNWTKIMAQETTILNNFQKIFVQ